MQGAWRLVMHVFGRFVYLPLVQVVKRGNKGELGCSAGFSFRFLRLVLGYGGGVSAVLMGLPSVGRF
jgi:hypothetical protein